MAQIHSVPWKAVGGQIVNDSDCSSPPYRASRVVMDTRVMRPRTALERQPFSEDQHLVNRSVNSSHVLRAESLSGSLAQNSIRIWSMYFPMFALCHALPACEDLANQSNAGVAARVLVREWSSSRRRRRVARHVTLATLMRPLRCSTFHGPCCYRLAWLGSPLLSSPCKRCSRPSR